MGMMLSDAYALYPSSEMGQSRVLLALAGESYSASDRSIRSGQY